MSAAEHEYNYDPKCRVEVINIGDFKEEECYISGPIDNIDASYDPPLYYSSDVSEIRYLGKWKGSMYGELEYDRLVNVSTKVTHIFHDNIGGARNIVVQSIDEPPTIGFRHVYCATVKGGGRRRLRRNIKTTRRRRRTRRRRTRARV